jgi:hypothetical protein
MDSEVNYGRQMYDLLYRRQSHVDVHAGIGSLMGYVITETGRFSTREITNQRMIDPMSVLMAGACVAWLAERVCDEFGIGTHRIVSLQVEIMNSMMSIDE